MTPVSSSRRERPVTISKPASRPVTLEAVVAVAGSDELAEPVSRNGHQTSRAAVRLLLDKDACYHEPSRRERDALLVGFAMHRRVLYGAAFDVVRLSRPLDLTDVDVIASNMDAIEVCEIKSTNRASVKSDLRGYFFNITAAELLVAQSLGSQYKFVFVNTITREHQELSLNEVFARARAMYPAWHLRF